MDQNPISITQALNHIQSWLNAGEYDKVIQGCTEILEMEPTNTRALALMKLAEEKRHQATQAPSTPTPVPTPQPKATPINDPLAHLQVENLPSFQTQRHSESRLKEPDAVDKRQLFLAMLIPAILVVILGGGVIWLLSDHKREETVSENSSTDLVDTTKNTEYLDNNTERVESITQIAKALEAYKLKNGAYPAASQIGSILVQSTEFSKIPKDPRQGEVDKAGERFGYVYAVYDSQFGKTNQYYVLSALFEDSKGFGSPWSVGESIKNHTDYRDVLKDNVSFIGGDDK